MRQGGDTVGGGEGAWHAVSLCLLPLAALYLPSPPQLCVCSLQDPDACRHPDAASGHVPAAAAAPGPVSGSRAPSRPAVYPRPMGCKGASCFCPTRSPLSLEWDSSEPAWDGGGGCPLLFKAKGQWSWEPGLGLPLSSGVNLGSVCNTSEL